MAGPLARGSCGPGRAGDRRLQGDHPVPHTQPRFGPRLKRLKPVQVIELGGCAGRLAVRARQRAPTPVQTTRTVRQST